jgi:hypothetical protein
MKMRFLRQKFGSISKREAIYARPIYPRPLLKIPEKSRDRRLRGASPALEDGLRTTRAERSSATES